MRIKRDFMLEADTSDTLLSKQRRAGRHWTSCVSSRFNTEQNSLNPLSIFITLFVVKRITSWRHPGVRQSDASWTGHVIEAGKEQKGKSRGQRIPSFEEISKPKSSYVCCRWKCQTRLTRLNNVLMRLAVHYFMSLSCSFFRTRPDRVITRSMTRSRQFMDDDRGRNGLSFLTPSSSPASSSDESWMREDNIQPVLQSSFAKHMLKFPGKYQKVWNLYPSMHLLSMHLLSMHLLWGQCPLFFRRVINREMNELFCRQTDRISMGTEWNVSLCLTFKWG